MTEYKNDEPIMYARDIDGTGSLHPCDKNDPGAIALYQRADLAPQAGSVDVEGLRKELRKISDQTENSGGWHFVDKIIDHLAALTASRPVVVGVAALKQEDLNNPYTDRSDNICYWSGWNDCIDDLLKRNFLAGAPVGGDRPAIPGLQEAIERREKLLATKRTLGHENRGIHTEGDPIFEAAKLYASCQSGVPDGYVCVPREPTEAMLDAIADQPYGANAAYEKLIAAAEGKK